MGVAEWELLMNGGIIGFLLVSRAWELLCNKSYIDLSLAAIMMIKNNKPHSIFFGCGHNATTLAYGSPNSRPSLPGLVCMVLAWIGRLGKGACMIWSIRERSGFPVWTFLPPPCCG